MEIWLVEDATLKFRFQLIAQQSYRMNIHHAERETLEVKAVKTLHDSATESFITLKAISSARRSSFPPFQK